MTREEKIQLLQLHEEKQRREYVKGLDCNSLTMEQSKEVYLEVQNTTNLLLKTKAQRHLVKTDLFYLLTEIFKRPDIWHPWMYERCREVQANPDGYLDLWGRDHRKSTIITFAKTIQDITINPNVTIGIFSHTRPIAKGFLDQIKRELEINETLKALFPEIFYQDPQRESPKWSLDSGIIVKRQNNPKECTVEAWGLVDGQPTGKHFIIRVYDDVVTRESVTTPEQIKKVTDAWALSQNLGTIDGKSRHVGTRYHIQDTYAEMMKKGSVKERIHPATQDGQIHGMPVFLPQEILNEKKRDMGSYIFSCQMLQNPLADKAMSFKREWLSFYKSDPDLKKWNIYILVDPAGEKKKTNDYTVMMVIGLGPDQNYYLIDGLRDRLNLTERTQKVFEFVLKYNPLKVGYEKYGIQSDIEHIEYVMEQKNYRFQITELGGATPKNDRIRKLIPVYEQKRFYLPERCHYVDYEGNSRDLVKLFIDDEYLTFPVCSHDDMLDCQARILDPLLAAEFPREVKKKKSSSFASSSSWMG